MLQYLRSTPSIPFASLKSVVCFVVVVCLYPVSSYDERVLLSNIDTLTFHKGEITRTRHARAIPQLTCKGGTAKHYPELQPHTFQCYNKGNDGHDVQWECKADLSKEVVLGKTVVNCEGYDYPDDEYVVYGSCGLKYDLNFIDDSPKIRRKSKIIKHFTQHLEFFAPYLPLMGLVGLGLLIWSCCLRPSYTDHMSTVHQFTPDAVPVSPSAPFSSEDPPNYDEAMRDHYFSSDYIRRRSTPYPDYGFQVPSAPPPQPQNSQWFPKSSTQSSSWVSNGLAAGAGFLGGYFFGSRDRAQHCEPSYAERSSRRLHPEFVNDHSFEARGSSSTARGDRSSDSSSSGDTYTATGFATTTRR